MNKMITQGDFSIKQGPFEPSLESLKGFQCPDWFKDAKFGIWSHWGPQSVPMFGDWYARNMYIEGSPQYLYHQRKYGHQSQFGYKDIVKLWTAENFNPSALMDLYVAAGAKYFVAQAMHHDNFDNFNSTYQPRFNSVAMGPKRDIVMAWKEQAKKHGLPFGVTEHLAASYGWLGTAKSCDTDGMFKGVPYDGNDDAFSDLYYCGNNGYKLFDKGSYDRAGWYTDDEQFQRHWFLRIKDLIDKVQPDLLYSDGGLPFALSEMLHEQSVNDTPYDITQKGIEYGLKIVAHLYNTSACINGQNLAVYNQKDKNKNVFSIGILDIERSQEDKITPYYWQTDTSIGDWFYNVKDVYKPWNVIVESIIDISSKNGNMLLCVNQKPDGTLDCECEYTLKQIAKWMKINSEGIHGTRHFRVMGEGSTNFKRLENFEEKAIEWQPGDIRYTQNEKMNTIYAFMMRHPNGSQAVLRELNSSRETVSQVALLGGEVLRHTQNGAALIVDLPDKMPSELINCLKITVE